MIPERDYEAAIAATLCGSEEQASSCPFCGAGLHARMCDPQRAAMAQPYPAILLRGPFVFARSSAGYTGIWLNGAELSNREILRTLNEQGEKVTAQEGEIQALRLQLAGADEHVGALVKTGEAAIAMADAITAYFNKRGVAHSLKTGNEDIMALGDALSEFGPMALTAPPARGCGGALGTPPTPDKVPPPLWLGRSARGCQDAVSEV